MVTPRTPLAFGRYGSRRDPLAATFDLNQALRRLVYDRLPELALRNIGLILNLASELSKNTADNREIDKVLFALFGRAQKAILGTVKVHGMILIRTERKAGKIQLSITDNGIDHPFANVFPQFFEGRLENCPDLSACAEIVQDQGGELYAWRPRDSSFSTIFMDLPV